MFVDFAELAYWARQPHYGIIRLKIEQSLNPVPRSADSSPVSDHAFTRGLGEYAGDPCGEQGENTPLEMSPRQPFTATGSSPAF